VLYPGATGRWCLHGPEDRFIRLQEEPARVASLARHLTAEPNGEPDEGVRELAAAFASYGLLDSPPSGVQAQARRVAVAGDGPVGAELREILTAAGIELVNGEDADLLIACAGWLPDAEWQRLDALCTDRGIAWHRVYQEGMAVHLGPFTLPGQTASYADARSRRLAASPFADELLALWRHLDGGESLPEPPVISPAAAGVAAGLLAADVLAWLADRPVPSRGCAVEIDLESFVVRRRPVLPVPRDPLTEGVE
jgi:bacteriocin biosynthesis cyclodehydratase domain-containing protein